MSNRNNFSVAQKEKPKKLSTKDWIFVICVLTVSGVLVYYLLRAYFPGYRDVRDLGIAILFGLMLAGACAYAWQFDSLAKAKVKVQTALILVSFIVGCIAFLIGARFDGENLFHLITNGVPKPRQFQIVFPWSWFFGISVGTAYVQLWTLMRVLIAGARSRAVEASED